MGKWKNPRAFSARGNKETRRKKEGANRCEGCEPSNCEMSFWCRVAEKEN